MQLFFLTEMKGTTALSSVCKIFGVNTLEIQWRLTFEKVKSSCPIVYAVPKEISCRFILYCKISFHQNEHINWMYEFEINTSRISIL